MISERLQIKIGLLPEQSGVYLMKNSSGAVIYVGKAVNLKRRVSSYFHDSADHSPKTRLMISEIDDFELITVSNELEALLLECSLIKKYRPPYNILLKDGKGYPFIEITTGDTFPAIRKSKGKVSPESRMFGPYPSSDTIRSAISEVRKRFGIRICQDRNPKRGRPCLYGHIGLCLAPCCGKTTREEYGESVRLACKFLGGSIEESVSALRRKMEEESERMNFEKCSVILRNIRSIEKLAERQVIISDKKENRDYIGFHEADGDLLFKVLIVRDGRLDDRGEYRFSSPGEISDREKLKAFLLFYYGGNGFIPPEIYSSCLPEDNGAIESLLSEKAGRRVRICAAPRGRNRELQELAASNAKSALEAARAAERNDPMLPRLEELQRLLRLPSRPDRIETYDISNLSGKNAVGSMTVLTRGRPDKSKYRKFRIRGKDTPDDFAMMREMLTRRLSIDENDPKDEWKRETPDLIIIDGGKGQLGAVADVIGKAGIPFAGLAKRNEEIYFHGESAPLVLPKDSPALAIIRLGRDEAHRFAITYHRKLRERIDGKRK